MIVLLLCSIIITVIAISPYADTSSFVSRSRSTYYFKQGIDFLQTLQLSSALEQFYLGFDASLGHDLATAVTLLSRLIDIVTGENLQSRHWLEYYQLQQVNGKEVNGYRHINDLNDNLCIFNRSFYLSVMAVGKELYQQRDFYKAINAFEIVFSVHDTPDVMSDEYLRQHVVDSTFYLGLCWKQMGDVTRAGHYYSLTCSLDPHHIKAALNYACLHHERGDLPRAVQLYKYVVLYLMLICFNLV